jgi:hypothetical protein
MRELVASDFRDQLDNYLEQLAKHGEAQGFLIVVTRSGETRVWQYHNTLRTVAVSVPALRGMTHDATELVRVQRLLRDANQQLRRDVKRRERVNQSLQLFRKDAE